MIHLDNGGAAQGFIRFVDVVPAQRSAVHFIWIDTGQARSAAWRIVADDAPHIVYSRFTTADSHASRLHIVGARTRFADIDNTRRIVSIGIRLEPGALPELVRTAAIELTDKTAPLDLFLKCASQAHCRFDALDAKDPDAAVASIISDLVGRTDEPDPRIQLLERMNNVAGAARGAGITERALNSWSHQCLGLGPRRWLRIRRLHRALLLRQRDDRLTWSEVATRAGYADHSHCVRDCRDLLGETPGTFMVRGDKHATSDLFKATSG
jgi:AraC-like DNA-binding protein